MCSFMGKSRVWTVCRCKGLTAAIKCFPNPIKRRVCGEGSVRRGMREPEKGRKVGFIEQIFLLSLLRAVCDIYEDVIDWCVSEF